MQNENSHSHWTKVASRYQLETCSTFPQCLLLPYYFFFLFYFHSLSKAYSLGSNETKNQRASIADSVKVLWVRNSFVSLLIIGRKKGSSTNVFTETQAKSSLNRKKSNKKKTYQNKWTTGNFAHCGIGWKLRCTTNYVVVDYTWNINLLLNW